MINKFTDGARVVFIGDSITAANISLKWIIKAYKNLGADVRFFNCGVAGGTADFAVTSYDKDIKRYRPTHAVVSFGINDSRRDLLLNERSAERLELLTEAYEKYKVSLGELVDRLLMDGVTVTLCTPVPYDEYSEGEEEPLHGAYSLMLGYSEYVRNLAREKGVALYDQHSIISTLMASDQIHSPDRIHPTDHGYFVLARELLNAQGIDVGDEGELPEYFSRWHSYVARLRKILATECMIIPSLGEGIDSDPDVKVQKMRDLVGREGWAVPVFESFCRAYVDDKPEEEDLYRLIDESYESDIK